VIEAVLGWEDGEAVGFALFFHNFSTFLRGAACIWKTCPWCRRRAAAATASC